MVIKNNNNNNYISESELASLLENDSVSLKDYITLIRVNWVPIILITLAALTTAVIYSIKTPDIYKSTTMLKLSKPKGNILEAPLISEFSDTKSTFVQNEIEILKSYTIKEKVAKALIDSLKYCKCPDQYIIYEKDFRNNIKLLPVYQIVKNLEKIVTIEQKNDLEIINISAESVSPFEASLIANIYAYVYHDMNLNFSRLQMINVREFLEKQSNDKHNKLIEAENTLRNYQEKGGIIALDEQSKALIDQLTDFESKKNAAKIELTMIEKNLADYKKELAKQEPRIKDYMDKYAIEPYLEELQKGIAQYELKRDLALNNIIEKNNTDLIKSYNSKINELKDKRDKKLEIFKTGMLASSSEEVKQLIQKVLESEVKYHALSASFSELNSIVNNYESKFNALPKRTIDLARLEREKGESEKLYLLLQEKYQEAMINEQSTPGDVLIIDPARIPYEPFKPNRKLIVLTGLLVGLGFGLAFIFIKNYFDNTVQTPEDIQKLNINLMGWVPQIEYITDNEKKEFEFIVYKKPNSIPSEAYRALRTRIQFSKVDRESIKTILLTSGSPQEGKTTTSVNLAGSFALAGKRTVLIDCDLRKPRVHKIFKQQKAPGFTDYIFENASYNEIIRKSELKDLSFIASGTIPTNPAEILGSNKFIGFLEKLKDDFEIIIIDSPPVLAVTDAEILSRIADVSVLVAAANITEIEVMKKAVELLQHDHGSFIGILLNNFIYKNGYGNYYKNYYYYQSSKNNDKGLFKQLKKNNEEEEFLQR